MHVLSVHRGLRRRRNSINNVLTRYSGTRVRWIGKKRTVCSFFVGEAAVFGVFPVCAFRHRVEGGNPKWISLPYRSCSVLRFVQRKHTVPVDFLFPVWRPPSWTTSVHKTFYEPRIRVGHGFKSTVLRERGWTWEHGRFRSRPGAKRGTEDFWRTAMKRKR